MDNSNAVGLKITTDTKQTVSMLEQLINKLDKTNQILDKISINKGFEKTNKQLKNINNSLKMPNLTSYLSSFKRLGQVVANNVDASASYLENLNLMQVAYGDTRKEAERFIDKISDTFGLNESTLTRQLGYYRQIGNALSIDNDYAELLASNLLKMQLDVSSLYNLSFERSGEVLQSSMAGQTKPIRGSTGGDITQGTLQTDLDRLGIDRQVSSLNRSEKAILIYLSLERQLVASQQDLAKTINSTANQQKIFSEQTQRLATVLGHVLTPAFTKLLTWANGLLMVINELVGMFAIFVGFEMPEYDPDSYKNFNDLTDYLDNATGSAGKLKKELNSLRGWDKLNAIITPKDSSFGVGGTGLGGVDNRLLNALKEYDLGMDSIHNKATKIRDAIMEWLGFTYDENEAMWKFDRITLGTVIGSLIGTDGILWGANKILGILNKIGLVKYKNIGELYKQTKNVVKAVGNGTLLAKIGTKASALWAILKKFTPTLAGISGTLLGSKGVYNAIKLTTNGMDKGVDQGKKFSSAMTLAATSGAIAGMKFGPIGAIVGGLTGTLIAGVSGWKGYKDGIQDLVDAKLFGNLSISAEEWLEILNNSGEKITNYSEKNRELKSTIKDLSDDFNKASEAVDLYGYKFGLTSYKVTKEDTQNMKNAIDTMCTDTSKMIEENTNYSLAIWGDSFSKMSILTEEEEKNILDSIARYSSNQQKELDLAQNNITNIYDKAIKTRGYLTDEEYNYIQEQLKKIRELTQKQMSVNQTELERFKKISANKNNVLDKESYNTFKETLITYQNEQKDIINKNYNELLNDAERYHQNNLDDTITYNNMLAEADAQRDKDEKELSEKIKGYQNDVLNNLIATYKGLEGKTDEQSKQTRKTLENIFKDLNIDDSDLKRQMENSARESKNKFWGILNPVPKDGNKWANITGTVIKTASTGIGFSGIGKGILGGIIDKMTPGKNAFDSWASKFGKGIKKALGINSPSRLMKQLKIGDYVVQGIEEGMYNEIPYLAKVVDRMASTIQNEINNNQISGFSIGETIVNKPNFDDYDFPENNKMITNTIKNLETTDYISNPNVSGNLRQSTFNGMMDALSVTNQNNQNINVTIVAEDDGILNNIKFKQKQHDRQFGF